MCFVLVAGQHKSTVERVRCEVKPRHFDRLASISLVLSTRRRRRDAKNKFGRVLCFGCTNQPTAPNFCTLVVTLECWRLLCCCCQINGTDRMRKQRRRRRRQRARARQLKGRNFGPARADARLPARTRARAARINAEICCARARTSDQPKAAN